jgi:hypothetical protein
MTNSPLNPVPHKQMHPGMQFLTLIGLLILMLIVGSFIGIAVITARYGANELMGIMQNKVGGANAASALWILQFTGTTFPILITPIIFSYLVVRDPDEYLKNNFHFPWLLMILVFLTMMLANPLIEYLGNLNAKMVLPKALKWLEDWMRESEDQAKKLSDTMMQMNTFWQMIFDLLFIGLLTAVVEEILFRGCFQTIFLRWTNNVHAAVWISAILFSAMHLEFYGFLPRVVLGVLFGYFTAWSGSIWPAIWGHFINNGTVVVVTYLYQNKMITLNPDENQTFNNTAYLVSFIITLFLLFIYWYLSNKWHAARYGEELD